MITSDSGSAVVEHGHPAVRRVQLEQPLRAVREIDLDASRARSPFSASAIRTRAQYGQRGASIELHGSSPIRRAICS